MKSRSGIVNSLRLKLGRGRRRYETSAEGYDVYLQARARGIEQGLWGEIQSIDGFEQAIGKDPSFAPAYAGLATALVALSGSHRTDAPESSKMQTAAQKAIELDPLLAEAHGALGMVYARQALWDLSEKSFRRALELDPNDSVLYGNFALDLLFPLNRIQEAVVDLRIGVKHDPVAARLRFIFANVLIAARCYDEAAGICLRLPADFPGRNTWLARARGRGSYQGSYSASGTRIKWEGWGDGTAPAFLSYAYGLTGHRSDAERLAAKTSGPFFIALTYTASAIEKKRSITWSKWPSWDPRGLAAISTTPSSLQFVTTRA
jgi:tetratricopeptide (TPR) repeat protein